MPPYIISLTALALFLLAGLVSLIRLNNISEASRGASPFSQLKVIADDPSPIWDIGPIPDVLMNFENSVHYQLNTSTAAFEWAALVPSNGGIVHVGPERQPFLPSIFHQLRCLDIIRKAYVKDSRGEGELGRLSHHCLNYLRQMIMCQSNLRLEPVVDPNGVHAVQPWGELSCRDWRSVYNAVAENDVEFARWKRSQEQGESV